MCLRLINHCRQHLDFIRWSSLFWAYVAWLLLYIMSLVEDSSKSKYMVSWYCIDNYLFVLCLLHTLESNYLSPWQTVSHFLCFFVSPTWKTSSDVNDLMNRLIALYQVVTRLSSRVYLLLIFFYTVVYCTLQCVPCLILQSSVLNGQIFQWYQLSESFLSLEQILYQWYGFFEPVFHAYSDCIMNLCTTIALSFILQKWKSSMFSNLIFFPRLWPPFNAWIIYLLLVRKLQIW